MMIRTITVSTRPGRVNELARRWRETVAPHMPKIPGLREVYLCANRDADTVVAIQLWENPPGGEAHEIHERQQLRRHRGLDPPHSLPGGGGEHWRPSSAAVRPR